MITAIVHIDCETNQIPEVAERLANLDGVSEVYSVAGSVDLIAIVRVRAFDDIAEVIAGGSVHVYGALRGRALAGVSGDTNARIFCHSLEAEVVSVAGLYRVSEDFGNDVLKKAVQIFLRDGYLHMEPL